MRDFAKIAPKSFEEALERFKDSEMCFCGIENYSKRVFYLGDGHYLYETLFCSAKIENMTEDLGLEENLEYIEPDFIRIIYQENPTTEKLIFDFSKEKTKKHRAPSLFKMPPDFY